jgi:hypothetical protein
MWAMCLQGQQTTSGVNAQRGSAKGASQSDKATGAKTNPESTETKAPLGKYFEESIVLPPESLKTAKDVAGILGSPIPFSFGAASDGHSIQVYCTASKFSDCDPALLQKIEIDIAILTLGPKAVEEIRIDHAASLGDLVSRAQNLNYKGIFVQAIGDDKIRVTRTGSVGEQEYSSFKAELTRLSWQLQPESPVARAFYINASDASGALAGNAAPPKSGGKETGIAAASPTITVQATATQNTSPVAPCPATLKDDTKDTTKDTTASSGGAGSQGTCVAATTSADKKPTVVGDSTKPSQPSAKPAFSISTLNPDVLVFSDDRPGDDEAVAEHKRILSLIDFPRPEVIINTFSFQTSASDPQVLASGDRQLQSAIGNYNNAIQAALFRAWLYVQSETRNQDFFDKTIYNYLTKRFVSDPAKNANAADLYFDNAQRNQFDLCDAKTYCLGYTSLFHPIRPSLTDMLFAVIAAKSPAYQFRAALEQMEGFKYQSGKPYSAASAGDWASMSCDEKDIDTWQNAKDIISTDEFKISAESNTDREVVADSRNLAGIAREIARTQSGSKQKPGIFPMYCFREVVEGGFPVTSSGYNRDNLAKPLRAALANFLFHYKMSQQFPHEFSGYELSESAQELNSELNPIVVAFNRDLAAALRPIQDVAETNAKCNGWWGWGGHGTCFINNGIISVRTVSGKETIVDTATQSYFDATNPPSLTDVVSSVGQASANVPGALKTNLTANEAAVIIGALNSVKPATSQVGRQFKIDITPRSLSGASSAELEISLTAGETAAPTLYSSNKSNADNLSRVAKNSTTTKVRLESIKLFEISSFTAVLQRSRRNFPLLPPFVEIPYLGSLLSVPVPGAKEYHRSTAIMSAVVVPTAADLANSVVFSKDRVLVAGDGADPGNGMCRAGAVALDCYTTRALSLSDFHGISIWEFNKKMVRCFADNESPASACNTISFGSLLPER